MSATSIVIRGAKEHNLKNIDIEIPRDRLVVITGPSGSGKSSLAFDTIYAEGQRRYVESLSAYARQFLNQMEKPDVESIEGLSPAISIEQKTVSKNPRSTVGTSTEIYDYLRLLFARVGKPHCWKCGRAIASQTVQQMVDRVLELPEKTKFQVLAPIVRGRKGEYRQVFEDLQREGYVRVRVDGEMRDLSDEIVLERYKTHDIEVVIDRLVHKSGIAQRLADSIEVAVKLAEGIVLIDVIGAEDMLFSEKLACIDCGISYSELEPRMFSFNSPHGACPDCDGLGTQRVIDPRLVVPDPSKSIQEGALAAWNTSGQNYFYQMLASVAEYYHFSLTTPFEKLPKKLQNIVLYGTGDEKIRYHYQNANGQYDYQGSFEGAITQLERRYHETASEYARNKYEEFMSMDACPSCQGQRLGKESLSVKIHDYSIIDMTRLSVKEALKTVGELSFTEQETSIAEPILKEIKARLGFMSKVGLDYLSLDRATATLSGGEGQRIRLATQIGSGLVGVLYILDEPSIGLHQRDNTRLLEMLEALRDMGNTILVVEHDEDTMRCADYILDLGPAAGKHGGEVVAHGTPAEIMENKASLTGSYLSHRQTIPLPDKRRKPFNNAVLTIRGACEHNLKDLDVEIPLGVFVCVTGVSGSGKSTLVDDILYRDLAHHFYRAKAQPGACREIHGHEHIDKVIDIDQSPIGRTPRSNPATYTGLFSPIRDLFAKVPEARMRGYKPGRFSFNVKGGRCEACKGDGLLKIEMHFLPDVYVTCDVCHGRRYNRETLEIRYKGKNIAEVLDMTVADALYFMEHVPSVSRRLQTLYDVGLDYIHLGQQATTLSGGEAQRVKLSRELSKKSTGNTLYILDEPTTGLHFDDIKKLLEVLGKLVDAGNTVLVIEHNLDVIKSADYLIDLGPEGGDDGGRIVATGTPEEVMSIEASHTGRFLKKVLTSRIT
ncbi:excinuclease ABC subunit A [candidate division KSB3 bacterium]|uniref:UvrABC system protein A n=1 Tax=candidate division KSB3 bacterium TaxID=2044937 RepID=A0A2G6E128_9BACT|nr:MAG: excinuclease ABC subunit A [candidate division KSB3 bacterium]PIE28409.1 MAG: excinuclease ABC subunit A [candidate division KSB3 bacterium]